MLSELASSVVGYLVLVALVAVERLFELVRARRNAAWAFAAGGREVGAGHYPVMVLLHSGLLIAAPLEVVTLDRPFIPWIALGAFAAVAVAQGLRAWCIATLGRRWNTRVIVVPGLAPLTGGPYRFLRHPNYLAVVVEVAALPLVHGAWITAAVFSLANALLLAHRIRVEEAALAAASDYDAHFGDLARLLPRSLAPARQSGVKTPPAPAGASLTPSGADLRELPRAAGTERPR